MTTETTTCECAPATLEQLVADLAKYRQEVAEADAEWKAKTEEFEQFNADFLAERSISKGLLKTTEEELRKLAVDVYTHKGDPSAKQLTYGVSIEIRKALNYDLAEALEWAKREGKCLLLDVTAFEQVAVPLELQFVKQVDVPSAKIARDLSKALEQS